LRVLKYLSSELNVNDEQKNAWYRHWVIEGFKKIENLITGDKFCFGDKPTLADACLIPQVFNALRFNVDMSQFPKIDAVYKHCNTVQAFIDAAPENQFDAA
jgi:maleylacetoacetate isomerase